MKKYWRCGLVIMVLTAVIMAGPSLQAKQAPSGSHKQAGYLKITDDAGRTTVLGRKPGRIVVLSPSFLELLYAVDGKAVGRPSSSIDLRLPKQGRSIPEVGFAYHINVEKVVALQPDLVIAMQGIQDALVPVLESNRIPVIVLKYKTYDDVFDKIALFGNIAGTKQKAAAMIQNLKAKLKMITAKLPNQITKVAILRATSKSVSLELENSIAGNTAKLLRLQNVAAGSRPFDSGADLTPYSLEKLVESDPDLIFIVTMGKTAEIENTLRLDVENNSAWSTLRAVRHKKVAFLPSELFLLNPGLRIPESAAYMAKLAYPEVYGSVQ
ncbi:iron complex transport system substrate-binding protein [Hydrogenispora ethanolica]|uniref:Iron complex transport system substrate-binding protein n=1 Tax=Hydrogenispora ethanolica TaxID=1082276 RepID=A0A4R1RAX0_HYDET|nr:ABC transporter substrate-binding protein [Hydrogenispora ethanolica]TCL62572.1 iron complex transport system substrate-binding protein [Hydrogenispora ethanolica]